MLRVGPAGWDYKDWAGIVYPDPKPRGFDPLSYLSRYFDTIEINSTFYRPVEGRVASGWAKRVEANRRFRFTAKLWRRFTHEREAAWARDEVRATREGLEALVDAGKLGAVLLQFPWSFRNDARSREWLDDLFRAFRGLPLVLEVRHLSWNVPEVYESLTSQGVGFVNIDQPLFRNSIRPSATATAPTGYVRIHGRNYKDWFREKAGRDARYDYLYSADELAPWAERTQSLARAPRVKDVYVVANNHFVGKAPANALMLKSMLTGKPVDAPPALVQRYGEALAPFVRVPAPSASEGLSP